MAGKLCRSALYVVLPLTLVGSLGCPTESPTNGGDDPDTGSADATVSLRNIAFDPQSITIQAGQTVRWTNDEVVTLHTVTSGSSGDDGAGALFDSGIFQPGQSFEHTFNEPGTFVYFCELHPTSMFDATVIVE